MDWQTSEDTVPSAFITEANRRALRGTPPVTGAWREGDDAGERLFANLGPLELESGARLPHVRLAYETSLPGYGDRPVAQFAIAQLVNDAGLIGAADLATPEG